MSVVPISQWFFHGITNSTDVGVRRISPASPVIRSRGTTMCTPLDARTRNRPRRAGQRLQLVGPHAGAVEHDAGARPSASRPSSASRTVHADDAVGLADEARSPASTRARPRRSAPPCGRRSACAGRRRPARRSSAPRRPARRRAGPGTSAAPRAATGASARAGCCGRPSCRTAPARPRRTAVPTARCVSGYRNGTGFTRCGASRVVISSRSRSASRTSPNSSCSR